MDFFPAVRLNLGQCDIFSPTLARERERERVVAGRSERTDEGESEIFLLPLTTLAAV